MNRRQDVGAPLGHLPRLQNRARTVDEAQLGRAFFAQPDHYSGRIRPEKWGNFSGNLHRVIALQPLERLHIKHPVVNFAIRAVVAVDAFAFEKELSLQWRPTFPSRRTARVRRKDPGEKILPSYFLLRRLRAGNQEDVGSSLGATRIMPCDREAVNNLLRLIIRRVTRIVRP